MIQQLKIGHTKCVPVQHKNQEVGRPTSGNLLDTESTQKARNKADDRATSFTVDERSSEYYHWRTNEWG